MPKPFLMTPGPSNVPPRVLEALSRPMIHHRSPDFEPIFSKCLEGMQYVLRTQNPVVILAGSGTIALEAAVSGVLSPGDKVITIEAGKFGQRWGDLARVFGMEVVTLETEWGSDVDPAAVQKALDENPDAKAVYATLTETSTAALSDIEALGKIVGGSSAILVVDAVSGLAADRIETDAWGVDIVVGGSQKALMLPPGLAFATVSPKAEKLIETASCPVYYTSLKKALKSLRDGTTPYTPAVSLMVGLNESLAMIRAEGIENVWARHRCLADGLRAGGRALGLEVFSQAPSNAVVAFRLPEGIDYKALMLALRDEFGLTIVGGQDRLKGKIFRMAAMGWADQKDVIQALGALEAVLRGLGHNVAASGAGVAAALESLAGAAANARAGARV